ncbi:hypothetical protein FKP32DRAFT_1083709 [Trametes sanguinea]|nr:hypothetical protein FKP32DRAFT_1083709 [Trametes sanguinea]
MSQAFCCHPVIFHDGYRLPHETSVYRRAISSLADTAATPVVSDKVDSEAGKFSESSASDPASQPLTFVVDLAVGSSEMSCPPGSQEESATGTNAFAQTPEALRAENDSQPLSVPDESAILQSQPGSYIPDDIFKIDLSLFDSHNPALYSRADVPPLEAFIPESIFPDKLLVHDPWENTHGVKYANVPVDRMPLRDAPLTYVRILPEPTSTGTPNDASRNGGRAAHLYLKRINVLGSGNHSEVYSAPLELRLDPNSPARSRVRVAAKVADAHCRGHAMLRHEAAMYNAFPRKLMEETVRTVEVQLDDSDDTKPDSSATCDVAQAQPTSSGALNVGDGCQCASAAQGEAESTTAHATAPSTTVERYEVVSPAVVPIFYGFYVALLPNGEPFQETHGRACARSLSDLHGCSMDDWPRPILLLEECGQPIRPAYTHREPRVKMYKELRLLFKRLHRAGFFHGSTRSRNLLIQPGPLSVPREERSEDSPSFRIVDFGRGEALSLGFSEDVFDAWKAEVLSQLREELYLSDAPKTIPFSDRMFGSVRLVHR